MQLLTIPEMQEGKRFDTPTPMGKARFIQFKIDMPISPYLLIPRKDFSRKTAEKPAAQYLAEDPEFVRQLVQDTPTAVLESEMTEFLGAGKSERTKTRQGYRSGHCRRDRR